MKGEKMNIEVLSDRMLRLWSKYLTQRNTVYGKKGWFKYLIQQGEVVYILKSRQDSIIRMQTDSSKCGVYKMSKSDQERHIHHKSSNWVLYKFKISVIEVEKYKEGILIYLQHPIRLEQNLFHEERLITQFLLDRDSDTRLFIVKESL